VSDPARRFVPEGERVIVAIKPHPLYIVLVPLGVIALGVVLAAVGVWVVRWSGASVRIDVVWSLVIVLIALRLLWQVLEWLARSFVLTDRRVIRLGGVLRRYAADIPLTRLQHVTMFKTLRERIFGLGTIGFATAGTGHVEAYWVMVSRPNELMRQVREAVAAAAGEPMTTPTAPDEKPTEILTIGLAGGIGSGKTTVANILADLGCAVSSSDRQAKEALDRDDVRTAIVSRFGADILDDAGKVDRRALAEFVFEDAEARRMLESITHPIVGQIRHAERDAAVKAGKRAFVIDAPLLFEAGVDRECDVVIFVDAPEDVRLARVAETRGWDAAEVDRRRRAQIPLQEKRDRSDHVLSNDADEAELRRRLQALLERIERDRRR
jgi:dephospho-CoA kinase